MTNQTLAVIIGNRDFFPDRLVSEGRREILAVLVEMGVEPVILGEDETKLGAVETWEDAKRCAELFKTQRARIGGILVVLPNFGDEKGIADAIKLSGMQVPILVRAARERVDERARRVSRRRWRIGRTHLRGRPRRRAAFHGRGRTRGRPTVRDGVMARVHR